MTLCDSVISVLPTQITLGAKLFANFKTESEYVSKQCQKILG